MVKPEKSLFLRRMLSPLVGCLLFAGGLGAEEQKLSRDEYLRMVLQQNKRLVLQELEKEISEHSVSSEKGVFEPIFAVSVKYDRGERENTAEQKEDLSSWFQTREFYIHKDTLYGAGISGLLPYGTQYTFSYSANRLRNNVNDPEYANEYYSFAGLEVSQPLLKRFGSQIVRAPIEIAEKEVQIKFHQLRRQLIETVNKAEAAYWKLALANERLTMRAQSVARAGEIVNDLEERLKAGKASELEVDQAKTGLMLREAQKEEAEQGTLEAANSMKALLSQSAIESSNLLVPTDRLAFQPRPVSRQDSMASVLKLHPDILVNDLQAEQEEIRIRVAKNEQLPEFNFLASYGVNAYSDDPNELWDDYSRRDYDAWYAGVEFKMGLLGNRTARGKLRAAMTRERQFAILRQHTLAEIGSSIDTLAGRLENLSNRIETLDGVVGLNRRLVDTAMTWLREGKGNIRSVLDLEEDLVEAQDRRLAAVADYVGAQLQLETLEAALLENRGIDVEFYRQK